MPIQVTFNRMKNSETVATHVHETMDELVKMTDNKFPFHVNLTKDKDDYQVVIHCNYRNKALSSKATHENLYKAISKSVDAIRVQVIRKVEKTRKP